MNRREKRLFLLDSPFTLSCRPSPKLLSFPSGLSRGSRLLHLPDRHFLAFLTPVLYSGLSSFLSSIFSWDKLWGVTVASLSDAVSPVFS